ncbi:MAG: hypothetical protein MZW92_34320 [Comamonadaceae bacterium]|nr:hypothetical protein [Comamonadaceae bacterium]
MVTGIDIVQKQIRVAAGEKLPLRAARHRRCAATRSSAASTPRTRTSSRPRRAASRTWHAPGGPGVRVDSHAYTNYFVPPNYDSMIGKLIVLRRHARAGAGAHAHRAVARWWSRASRPTSRCTAN